MDSKIHNTDGQQGQQGQQGQEPENSLKNLIRDHHHPSSSSSSSSSNIQEDNNNDLSFELSPIVLVTTLDGKLHALDRKTGTWNWTLKDSIKSSIDHHHHHPNPFTNTSTPSQNHHGFENDRESSNENDQDQDEYQEKNQQENQNQNSREENYQDFQELFTIEPKNDGDLYLFTRSSNSSLHPDRLEKLPISISQLINLSPFSFPNDPSSKIFIGKKESNLITINLKTGKIMDSTHHNLNLKSKSNSKSKKSTKSSNLSQNHHSCFEPLNSSSNSSSSSNHPNQTDLLYIGKTDYQISIYSKPNTLFQTLRYSTYTPSNLAHPLQAIWTRTPDGIYLEATHDGNLICFQDQVIKSSNYPNSHQNLHQTQKKVWQNSFPNPVTTIFDVVFPKVKNPHLDPTINHPYNNQPYSLQQPIILIQPKHSTFKFDLTSQSSLSSINDHQINLFNLLQPQASYPLHLKSSSSSQTPINLQPRAFVGKFHHSFYVMSQKNFPLVALAPVATFTALHPGPSIGTHPLLDSRFQNGFFHFSHTHRLLDPASHHYPLDQIINPNHHHQHSKLPLALDPTPEHPSLPPSDPSTLSSPLTSSSHSDNRQSSSLPAQADTTPIQLQQRAAQISSLIVRTFKHQLMSNNPQNSHSNQTLDDRLLDVNPVITIFFVLIFLTWWASRKLGPQSISRWDHLHQFVNRALGNESIKLIEPGNLNQARVSPLDDKKVTASILVNKTDEKLLTEMAKEDLLNNPEIIKSELTSTLKQKPKRRRGKRAGQKALAAAAKAEAEATKATTIELHSENLSVPTSESQNPSTIPIKSSAKIQSPKARSNVQKYQSKTVKLVEIPRNLDSSLEEPVKKIIDEKETNCVTVRFQLDQEKIDKESLVSSQFESYDALQPLRVGSLVVTNDTIGYGSHGTVVLKGTFQGRQVAVKRLLKDFVTLASHEVSLLQESDDHPNVVRYFVKESLDNFLYIALELCNASLYDLIERKQFKEYEELLDIFNIKKALKQITSGLSYLHKLKIVHRDIKPQNILISINRSLPSSKVKKEAGGRMEGKSFRMLISDFGLCKKLEIDESSFAQTANHAAGSFGYRAPEILRGQVNLNDQSNSTTNSSPASTVTNLIANGDSNGTCTHSELSRNRLTRSIDIFSLGCIYYYVLTNGEHPFGSRYEREVNILKDESCLDQLDGFAEEAFEAQELIRAMIRSNPRERPGTEQILENPYFWEPSKKLMFLCDSSDRFEMMEREPAEEALIQLEDKERFYRYLDQHHSDKVKKGKQVEVGENSQNAKRDFNKEFDWCKKVDKVLIENLGKYRKYDGNSIRDLLRVMRNKKHHYQDLPNHLKKVLGNNYPNEFLFYFLKKFPQLFLHVFNIITKNFKNEIIFQDYFNEL
ncbi:hypothetical protein O181_010056 [Austropuccinia psidii MF-1]|uniref:non-specific serine/threonine protein kinase n=1 Tax=Austropuccinia psidii MF-1 TaxID=1389203 RepID=A0A9Q3BQB6_9BASI|nr:hypothetical protein [Austropuccinia psidii MF-1]